jgi:hypothetical protein
MFVPAGVIAVIMGVEDELQSAGIDLLDRGFNFRRKRRELVIDNENSVGPDRYADVAARSGEHINVPGNMRRFDLNFREVLLLLRASESQKRKQSDNENRFPFHKYRHGFK